MMWIWQKQDWFDFKYDFTALAPFENQFLYQSGLLQGVAQHVDQDEVRNFIVDLASDEALFSSEIEGELLNRDSLRSSIRKQLGLSDDKKKASPVEKGMGELMVSLYQKFSEPMTRELLWAWDEMVMRGHWDVKEIGAYRTHPEPMQIVSGQVGNPKVHYEAPPSNTVADEMERYIEWFNKTAPSSSGVLPILTRAGIAHLYFECIHPFEDGNGRIGRAIAMKSIFQALDKPMIIALSDVLNRDKKNYYRALAENNHANEITAWLTYFAKSMLKAQERTQEIIDFVLAKKKFYEHFCDKLNGRQKKVIARLFQAGIDGFEGGVSAKNYIVIAKTSPSTATRDLQELVKIGALFATGELRGRRYFLKLA